MVAFALVSDLILAVNSCNVEKQDQPDGPEGNTVRVPLFIIRVDVNHCSFAHQSLETDSYSWINRSYPHENTMSDKYRPRT